MSEALATRVRASIRDVPDFPRPGIVFKDITPLLGDAGLFRDVCRAMAQPFLASGVTHVVAIESRGFLFAGPIAVALGAGLVPMRKPGKLPHRAVRESYALEYGTDALELHADALGAGTNALLVDDVLATGGTASAAARLISSRGGRVVGCSFLIILSFLPGLAALGDQRVEYVVSYRGAGRVRLSPRSGAE